MNAEVIEIPADEVAERTLPPEPDVRGDRSQAIDRLGRSMTQHGQLIACLVVLVGAGLYRIVDGETRRQAAIKFGLPLKVTVIESTDQVHAMAVVSNVVRTQLSTEELATAVDYEMQQGLSQAQSAAKLGISASQVTDVLKVRDQLGAETLRSLQAAGKGLGFQLGLAAIKAVAYEGEYEQALRGILDGTLTVEALKQKARELAAYAGRRCDKPVSLAVGPSRLTLPRQAEATITLLKQLTAAYERLVQQGYAITKANLTDSLKAITQPPKGKSS